MFTLNQTFIEAPSLASDAAWEALIPGSFISSLLQLWICPLIRYRGAEGRGFITVDDHGKPVPYSGQRADPETIRAVSMYHQLHCLVHSSDQL